MLCKFIELKLSTYARLVIFDLFSTHLLLFFFVGNQELMPTSIYLDLEIRKNLCHEASIWSWHLYIASLTSLSVDSSFIQSVSADCTHVALFNSFFTYCSSIDKFSLQRKMVRRKWINCTYAWHLENFNCYQLATAISFKSLIVVLI